MKPLQIGLFVVAGGFGGALVMNWQSRHYRTTVGMAVRMPAPMMKSPVLPPVPFLESYDPPVPEPESPTPEPESPTKVVPSWRPPRLAPARQPIRVHHSIKQPFAKPSYNRIPMPDPTHYGHSAFVFPVPNSGCRPMKAVESETIQAIVQLELGFVAVVEALRDWTTAFPSAGGVRPSPPVTSTGLAVWQRSPRDAFGRLQTVRRPVAMMKSPGSPPVPSLESYDPPVPEPEPIEALRDWTTTFPSAGGVRPSPPVTSSGLAVWQRGPRDAFGRLQTY